MTHKKMIIQTYFSCRAYIIIFNMMLTKELENKGIKKISFIESEKQLGFMKGNDITLSAKDSDGRYKVSSCKAIIKALQNKYNTSEKASYEVFKVEDAYIIKPLNKN